MRGTCGAGRSRGRREERVRRRRKQRGHRLRWRSRTGCRRSLSSPDPSCRLPTSSRRLPGARTNADSSSRAGLRPYPCRILAGVSMKVSTSSSRLEGAVAAVGNIPAAPRFQLERHQLAQVVCQVRFSPVLKIQRDDEVIPFQEAVRSDYPRYFKTEAVSIVLTPAGVQQQQGAGRLHRFQDTTGSFSAVLAPDFVALETTGYVDIDDF